MVAGFGVGDLEVEIVTMVGEADLFEGVDVSVPKMGLNPSAFRLNL